MPAHFLQAQFCKIGDLGKTFGYMYKVFHKKIVLESILLSVSELLVFQLKDELQIVLKKGYNLKTWKIKCVETGHSKLES